MVPRRQVCPKRHCLVVLLLWHTHGFSFLFSVIMVLVEGAEGRGTGTGPFFLIFLWKWKSGSSVAVLPSAAFSPQRPSAFSLPSGGACWASLQHPSLSFPFPLVNHIWPGHVLAWRSQVLSNGHRDGGNSERSPIKTFPRHLPKQVGKCLCRQVGKCLCRQVG